MKTIGRTDLPERQQVALKEASTTSSDAMCLAEVPDIETEVTLSCGNEYEVGLRVIGVAASYP